MAAISEKRTYDELAQKVRELERSEAELKQMKNILSREKQRMKNILDLIGDPIFVKDDHHRITHANRAFYDIFQLDENSAIGHTLVEAVPENERYHFLGVDRMVLDTGISDMREETLTVKDATRNIVTSKKRFIDESGEKFLVGSIHDITEQKLAERRFREAQSQIVEAEKLGALGTLTAGIAHELNNPMMGMLNYSQYCLKHVPKTNKAFSVLEDMLRETKRCAAIVNSLLKYSRMEKKNDENFDKIHISPIVDRTIMLLRYRCEKENVSIIRSGEDELPEIFAKASNLQQVFLNIIGNALDALSGTKAKRIHIHASCQDDGICIDISDNGCGITQNQISAIFDPFFTTKPPGQGTGLGLSLCRSIVEAHNGQIKCKSTPEKGTTFRIILPIRPDTSA